MVKDLGKMDSRRNVGQVSTRPTLGFWILSMRKSWVFSDG
jgi:hypothetical protein